MSQMGNMGLITGAAAISLSKGRTRGEGSASA